MTKKAKQPLAQRYVQLFGPPPAPGTIFFPENLSQPDPRQVVDSITTYGVLEPPIINMGALNAELGAGNK